MVLNWKEMGKLKMKQCRINQGICLFGWMQQEKN